MFSVSLADLLEYTDWERGKWCDWLRHHGAQVLEISAGPTAMAGFKVWGKW